jgi:hypothetical protein
VGFAYVAIKSLEIKLQLPKVLWLELINLELDGYE